MRRVHAATVAAQVIDLQTVGDLPPYDLPCDSVSVLRLAIRADLAITLGRMRSGPFPAFERARSADPCPEALLKRGHLGRHTACTVPSLVVPMAKTASGRPLRASFSCAHTLTHAATSEIGGSPLPGAVPAVAGAPFLLRGIRIDIDVEQDDRLCAVRCLRQLQRPGPDGCVQDEIVEVRVGDEREPGRCPQRARRVGGRLDVVVAVDDPGRAVDRVLLPGRVPNETLSA